MNARLPLLLLDVDGVLNPYGAPACPPGYTEHDFYPGDEEPVRLCAAHGPWLRDLATRFEIVWATAWETNANRLLSPFFGLPELPVIQFPRAKFAPFAKLPAIMAYAGDRPLVWIDDIHPSEAHIWAAGRSAPTLLITVDPVGGLTRAIIDRAGEWADDLS